MTIFISQKFWKILLKKKPKIIIYSILSLLITSCTFVLDGVYTWDSFIQEASSRGETFFAEATAPNGFIAFGSSNDSQWAANSMSTRICSENSGQVCQVTRTTSK
jgi:hypothetical protein